MSSTPPLAPRQDRAVATRLRLLDATVDELIDNGYMSLTTSAVALRAGVSRGAQQRYFPHKHVLVTEAVDHLTQRQITELQTRIESVPRGRARVAQALDVVFDLYSGRLFAATLDLAVAARTAPELLPIVAAGEKAVGRALQDSGAALVGADVAGGPEFARSWATAVATARGVALLRLLGHRADAVEAQWAFARGQVLRMLVDGRDADPEPGLV